MSFEAHDYPAYQLFTRRCYGTPRNQRQYVWNRRNWQELFDDVILVATQKEPTHFIGSIVLYREKDRKNGVSYFTIVDGQQRIISLTIFLASIAFWLRCHEADNEFHGTRQYLFTRDDSNNESIVIKSEQYLSLERIVCGIFSAPVNKIQNYDIAALVKRYASNPKDKNLVSAFSFFISNIYDEMQHSKLSPTQFLLALRSAITDKLLYVDIMASSEEDACTIFEILNARGSALEGHELLKNFIMRGVKPDGNIDSAKVTWEEIERLLGNNIERFVKHYATHKYRTSTQNSINDYKIIRNANKGIPTVPLLEDLYQKAIYYSRLINPIMQGEHTNCSPVEFKVYTFFKRHRQEQIRPILLSLIHQYEKGCISQEKYNETILFLYDFLICYTIIGQENSNKITNAIYSHASILENDYSDASLQGFIYTLQSKLPSKENFKKEFSSLGWSHHGGYYSDDRNKERVQIILEVLERYKSVNKECSEFTIEHILDDKDTPENGSIGNLIPLESNLNSRCNGKSLSEKLEIYKTSSFQTARNIDGNYAQKATIDIKDRAERMADEFYDLILRFKISSNKKESTDTLAHKERRENKSSAKETIGTLIQNARKSNSENSEPDFQQLSLF